MQQKPEIMYTINNITAFVNKVEPFPFLYPVLGLRSWTIVKGNALTTLHWTAKVYIFSAILLFSYGCIFFIPSMFMHSGPSYIFAYASLILYSTGSLNLLLFWFSNITSKTVLKIFKKLDDIESFVPKLNGFIHGDSVLFKTITLLSIIYVLFNGFLMIHAATLTMPMSLFPHVWRYIYIFTTDITIYQFCNYVNMTSSYANIIKFSMCEVFNKPEFYQKPTDPIMHAIKSKIIQYTKLDLKKRENIFPKLDLITMEIMYEKFMDAVELTNQKFNCSVELTLKYYLGLVAS